MKKTLILALVLALCVAGAAAAEQKRPMGEQAGTASLNRSGDYLYAVREDGTAEIVSYTWEKVIDPLFGEMNPHDELLEIPAELDGHAVTAIGGMAFRQCEMKSVKIPDSVTAVGANPFANCALLSEILVSQDHPALAVIDGALFSKADKRLICYPNGLESTAYAVPQGIEIIGDWAFSQSGTLTNVSLPDSVTAIGDYAFARCEYLSAVTLPGRVASIGSGAFSWCYRLRDIALPDSVSELGANPFAYCASLAEISVSQDHPALAVIDGALFDKTDMRLICYPEGLEAEEYAVPEGTEAIGDGAFSANIRLNRVSLPESVTQLGSRAFALCANLEEIAIPESVTSIGEEAFYGCDRVTLFVMHGSYAAQYGAENDINYTYQDANSWLNG